MIAGRGQTITAAPPSPRAVYYMLLRRLRDAGIEREIGCHALRATGVTALFGAGVRLEVVQRLAGHASRETTRLYDRRGDAELLDGIDRTWL